MHGYGVDPFAFKHVYGQLAKLELALYNRF